MKISFSGRPLWVVLFVSISVLLVQCRGTEEHTENGAGERERIAEKLGITLEPDEAPDSIKAAHLVRQWNGCHNIKYVDNLYGLYDATVHFYGVYKSRMDCIDVKRRMFQKYPDYFQRIIGGINVLKLPGGDYKCSFTKYITVGKMTAPVPAYLILRKTAEGNFVIISESDPETDYRAQVLKDSVQFIEQLFTASNLEIKGNFSGSGGQETLFVFPPEDPSCSECITSLFFSNELLPPLDIKQSNGANVLNEGDLDGDGADEFSVLTFGRSGGDQMVVYTFKRGQWIQLVKFKVNRNMLLENPQARKDAVRLAGQGYIFIHEWTGDGIREEKVNIWDF
jgi:hypothetical protein